MLETTLSELWNEAFFRKAHFLSELEVTSPAFGNTSSKLRLTCFVFKQLLLSLETLRRFLKWLGSSLYRLFPRTKSQFFEEKHFFKHETCVFKDRRSVSKDEGRCFKLQLTCLRTEEVFPKAGDVISKTEEVTSRTERQILSTEDQISSKKWSFSRRKT